jgi:exopolysaccharide biosynthesis polyprenyl glycosylphosphotransferase
MSRTFDGRLLRPVESLQDTIVCSVPEVWDGYADRAQLSSRVLISLRRLPLVGLAAVAATALAVAALRQSPVALVCVLVATALVQVPRAARPAGAPLSSAFAATLRAVVAPSAAIALSLYLLDAPARVVDDALLLGAVAAVAGGAAAMVHALRSRPPRVLVVGDLPQVRGLVARWIDDRSVTVVGGLVLGSPAELAASGLGDLGISSVGTIDDVVGYVDRHHTNLVVVAPGPAVNADDVRRLSWALDRSDSRLAVIGAAEHVAPHRIDIDVVGGTTMAMLARPRAAWSAALLKTVLDRSLAALISLVALPVVAAAAVAVRLDSAGPAFFTQTRVGRDGRLFTLYKLRTMGVDAETAKAELDSLDEGNGMLFKIREDPRVTRVGRFLRRTSIDELPQLLNVLKGQMSLVGPRPALPEEVARYTELERRRLAVKPGLTGLWQVSGRSSLSRERSMLLDTSYADNWRPLDDALILLRTVEAVVSRKGAY